MQNDTDLKIETIAEVVQKFKTAFGDLAFKVVQEGTGLTLVSKNWIEPPVARLEIGGDDFVALGKIGRGGAPRKGVISGMLTIIGLKELK